MGGRINKNAFRGYGFQYSVALFFSFFLEFNTVFIESEYEKKLDEQNDNNFDDFVLRTIDDIYCFQIKDYGNVTEFPRFENGYVLYGKTKSKISESGINIFVFYVHGDITSDYVDNFYNLKSKYISDANLYLIPLNELIIDEYLNKKIIIKERKDQLELFFKNRYNSSSIIKKNELPGFEIYSNILNGETYKIRQNSNVILKSSVTFIVAPPGYGKSHYVNELGVSSKQLYRFWISQDDKNYKERLLYKNFIAQLNYLFCKDKIKLDEDDIIDNIISASNIFAIDGLDHVYNYNKNDYHSYLSFIKKFKSRKNAKLLVLTRPIPNDDFEQYDVVYLNPWSLEETIDYCDKRGVDNYYIKNAIYKIAKGYPLITNYLVSDFLCGSNDVELLKDRVVSKIDDYYDFILAESNGNINNTISKIGSIALGQPFIHKNDVTFIYDETILHNLEEIRKDFPYLIQYKYGRYYFYHDSLYNYVHTKANQSLSNLVKSKIFNSLLDRKVFFMARFGPGILSDEQEIQLLKCYSNINVFLSIFSETFDYESVRVFYMSLLKILNNKKPSCLSIYEMYSFTCILLLLNRNYYTDNPNLSIQLYKQMKIQNKKWEDHIYSAGDLFNNLKHIDESNWKFENIDCPYISFELSNSLKDEYLKECVFFSVIDHDYSGYLINHLDIKNNYINQYVFGELLVNNYIHGTDQLYGKIIVDTFLKGGERLALSMLFKSCPFIPRSTHTFPLVEGIRIAIRRLKELGIFGDISCYKSIKELLSNNNDSDTFNLYHLLNGYIRLSNRKKTSLNLYELLPYFLMMDAYKDTTITYLPEAMAFFFHKKMISISECYIWIMKVYKLRDSGNAGFATDFVCAVDSTHYNELLANNFVKNSDFYLLYNRLPISFLNVIGKSIVMDKVSDMAYRYQGQDVSYETFGNLLKCKYSRTVKECLRYYNVSITTYKEHNGKEKVTIGELRQGYYKERYKPYYLKYHYTFEDVSLLKNPYGYKLPYVDMFDIFEDALIKNNLEAIIDIALSKDTSIFSRYPQYLAPMIFTIPALYQKYNKRINYKRLSSILKTYAKLLLRIDANKS